MTTMTTENPKRPVLVFVHGFRSSKASWTRTGTSESGRRGYAGPLIGDLVADDATFAGWDVDYFEYKTPLFSFNPMQQIPTIFVIGEQLKSWLRAKKYHTRPTTFVGHSQGGLVILGYLWNVLDEKEAPALGHVRQVILVATPQKGSALLLGARSVLGRLFAHAQEMRLRPLNDSVDELLAKITRDVLNADTRDESDRWPVPIRAFYGGSDGLVVKESARGELDPSALDSLDGDHFTVLRPSGPNDPKFLALAQAIIHPIGHKRIFRIDQYHATVAVKPGTGQVEMEFKNRKGTIPVMTKAHLSRHVTFSETNLCEERFILRYRTLAPDGYIKYTIGGTKDRCELSASVLQDYRDEGRQIRFAYRPQKGTADTCFLDLEIYNGFNVGNTSAHFHLQPLDEPLRCIESLVYELDLSGYVQRGLEVSTPRLFYYPHNPAVCDDLCGARVDRYRVTPLEANADAGLWRWMLKDVTGGVVDIVWGASLEEPGR